MTVAVHIPHPDGSYGGLRVWRDVGVWIAGIAVLAVAAFLKDRIVRALEWAASLVVGRFSKRQPLAVTAASVPIEFRRGYFGMPEYVIPLSIDEIPAPPSQLEFVEERDAWAASLDGVDAHTTAILVTVTGTEHAPVILTGLKVRVIERRAPIDGTHITYGPLGDAMLVRWMTVDLDCTPPEVTQTADERFLVDGDGEARPVTFPFKVSSTEAEVFLIVATTKRHYCAWQGELSWCCGADTGVTIIDDDGEPFRTTAPTAAPTYVSNDGAAFTRL